MCEPIWKWLYSENHHVVMDSSLCSLLSVSLSHWRMLFTPVMSVVLAVAFTLSYHILPTCLSPDWVCPISRADVSPVMDDGFFSEHHWWQTLTLVSHTALCTHISIVSLIVPSFLSIRPQCNFSPYFRVRSDSEQMDSSFYSSYFWCLVIVCFPSALFSHTIH